MGVRDLLFLCLLNCQTSRRGAAIVNPTLSLAWQTHKACHPEPSRLFLANGGEGSAFSSSRSIAKPVGLVHRLSPRLLRSCNKLTRLSSRTQSPAFGEWG